MNGLPAGCQPDEVWWLDDGQDRPRRVRILSARPGRVRIERIMDPSPRTPLRRGLTVTAEQLIGPFSPAGYQDHGRPEDLFAHVPCPRCSHLAGLEIDVVQVRPALSGALSVRGFCAVCEQASATEQLLTSARRLRLPGALLAGLEDYQPER